MERYDLAPGDMPPEVLETPVIARIFGHADTTPDALAIVAHGGDGEVRLSYRALRDQVTALADALRAQGIRDGEAIGFLLDNRHGYQAIITMLACNLLSAVYVPLNARSVPRELADAVDRSSAVMIVSAPEGLPKLAAIRDSVPALRAVISTEPSELAELDFPSMLAKGDPAAGGWPQIDMDRVSEIMFTSGTTAAPKAVAVQHVATAASCYIYGAFLGLTSDDVLESFFPVFTTASTKCVAWPILAVGGTLVLDPEMDVPAIAERCRRENTTIYYAVPAFFIFLLDLAARQEVRLDTMRLFIFGGAPMPEEAIRKLHRQFPGVGLCQSLGSTETGATGSALYPEDMLNKLGSVGKAYPYTEVRLVDENMNEVPVDTPGEFAVRSRAVFKEYIGDPENTAATLRDGWVLMGDIGRRDADGYLFHTDRKKDIIIRGGHNIGSMEVEGVLYRHPDVIEAAAVGVPHARLGEDVFVFVVRAAGSDLTAEALVAYCAENLADYKVPRHVAFVDAMPRNAMGKILKTTLRDDARTILAGRTRVGA